MARVAGIPIIIWSIAVQEGVARPADAFDDGRRHGDGGHVKWRDWEKKFLINGLLLQLFTFLLTHDSFVQYEGFLGVVSLEGHNVENFVDRVVGADDPDVSHHSDKGKKIDKRKTFNDLERTFSAIERPSALPVYLGLK